MSGWTTKSLRIKRPIAKINAFTIVVSQSGLVIPKYFQFHLVAHKVMSTTMYIRSVPSCPANMDNNRLKIITDRMKWDFSSNASVFSLKVKFVLCMAKPPYQIIGYLDKARQLSYLIV
jgi:hypothetical protein